MKLFTLIFNTVKVDDFQFVDDNSKVQIVDRWKNWQKFNLISPLHNDKIKANIVERFSGSGGGIVLSLTSILRLVICSVRSLWRVVLSSVHK